MKYKIIKQAFIASLIGLFSVCGMAEDHGHSPTKHAGETMGPACIGFGPQTPRDIDNKAGKNQRKFSIAPGFKDMNLCNIHFHTNAEYKAKDFSIYAGEGEHGHGGEYQCSMSKTLTKAELKAPKKNYCKGVKPGDTIEVHWVHSSCDVKPGKGLGSCLSKSCANPDLRVETQVFTVVNDSSAMNFNDLKYDGNMVTTRQSHYQPTREHPLSLRVLRRARSLPSRNVHLCRLHGAFVRNAPRSISIA
jgi:hypothetical protein